VEQHELFFAHLTVREHLTFHAINRNGGTRTRKQCHQMVEDVMGEMGLARCGDTIIGGGFIFHSKGE
jgi:ABC-type multidrug transport system ATPase subunit